MASRNDLDFEQKMNLIKEKERGLSHRELRDKFQVSVGAVSNILKRKNEYINDYETNRNKKLKRRGKNDLSQTINERVYEWFVAQRSKRIPVSGPILQEYARKIAQELGDSSDFKASNGWLDRFRTRYNVQFRVISGKGAGVEDPLTEQSPSLSEAVKMVRRLHMLSTTQYPELHLFVTQLQSKLIDVYLDSNISKQRSIHEFLKPV